MPEEFRQKSNNTGVDYFESSDGTTGLYVKLIDLGIPRESAEAVATHIQGIHERSFLGQKESAWRIVDRRAELQGTFLK